MRIGDKMAENLDLLVENRSRLREILLPYQNSDKWRSIWQLSSSVLPFIVLWYLCIMSIKYSYPLTLGFAILAAGFMIRTFIIFHDCGHGSFFKSPRANELVGVITGILTFTPYHHWRHDHAIHHATAGDLDRRGVGDVQILTASEYLALPRYKRFIYRVWRHPLVMFTIGSFLVFALFHRFHRPNAGRRERLSVYWTNFALVVLITGMVILVGWKSYILIQIPILFVASTIGVWLFYVQHNFEGTYWERHDRWDFFKAGLFGSSYYQLPAVLQWFSGNIGFHHIHHLNPRIPNYHLPVCYRLNPVLHVRPLTLLSSLRSLRLRLWDEESRRMIGFRELQEMPGISNV
jgi:omega-6 fatty acid desaturase (delta-12 desaturase)